MVGRVLNHNSKLTSAYSVLDARMAILTLPLHIFDCMSQLALFCLFVVVWNRGGLYFWDRFLLCNLGNLPFFPLSFPSLWHVSPHPTWHVSQRCHVLWLKWDIVQIFWHRKEGYNQKTVKISILKPKKYPLNVAPFPSCPSSNNIGLLGNWPLSALLVQWLPSVSCYKGHPRFLSRVVKGPKLITLYRRGNTHRVGWSNFIDTCYRR